MCDIVPIKCDDPACNRDIIVHIGDFSTRSDNVAVRCWKHRPPKDDPLKWAVFTKCEYYRVGEMSRAGVCSWYMAIRDYEEVDSGYDIGEEGDIVPNSDWEDEAPWN